MAGDDNNFAPSLDLQGDGDDAFLIMDIERTFGVKVLDATDWTTVGDIYQFLLETRSPEDQPGKCATAMAFYALRRAIDPDRKLAPDAALTAVLPGAPKQELRRLATETGLTMPFARAGTGVLAGLACGAAAAGALIARLGLVVALPLGILAAVLIGSDRGKYPAETLGQLAEQVAGMNFATLVARGADGRAQTIWKALAAMLADASGVAADRIAPETRLLAG